MLPKHKRLLDILVMAALFAPSFLFIKVAVQEISPITVIALRVSLAALMLLLVLKIRNISIPTDFKLWKYCFTLGFLINGFPFVCYSYSLALIPTSLSALINGLTPIVTVFLANIFLQDERLNLRRGLGVILGFSGFIVLFLPALLNTDGDYNLIGILLSFVGAIFYAFGAVYARKYVQKAPPLVAPTLQLMSSLIYLIPLAFIVETPIQELLEASMAAWTSVLCVALLGTALAFILYHRIVVQQGATALTMAMYLLPIFGTAIGVLFLNETITLNFALAGLLILIGVGIVNGMINLPTKRAKIEQPDF